jgi:hypothetical protein
MGYDLWAWYNEIKHWFVHDWLYYEQELQSSKVYHQFRICRYCSKRQALKEDGWADVISLRRPKGKHL